MTVKIHYTMLIETFHFFVLCTSLLLVIDMTQALGYILTTLQSAPSLGRNAVPLQAEDSFSDPQLLRYCLHGSVI